ncbi:MAG: heat-inducible transcriptional repressor HrcA [Verrucomicrobia bacterium]|nr:heat-inducible transcriptional repressor HrcA [Verrucomicrobiota bacterium]MBS0636665.1 heat-inducible transcriptional repressor HrcA [Verrucomicrobiota bacterium]
MKRSTKADKEKRILISLVEYYLKTGKAVGSNTLKEVGFPDLSSATIRNYFANLEADGLLKQQHTSGGRVPTEQAFRLYAQECLEDYEKDTHVASLESAEDLKAVALFLQRIAEATAEHTQCAAFLTAPRFDQDFVTDIKLICLDSSRCLAVILTSFGQVFTELLHAPHKISTHSIQRIQSYFHSRLMNNELLVEPLTQEEHELALRFYQETMARYLVSYANFSSEDIFTTGFSKLLRYPEFQEAESLASSLSLFENQTALRSLARDVQRAGKMKCWIGEELFAFLSATPNCCLISIPYSIGHKCVGSIGIIGPMRLPYKQIFTKLDSIAQEIGRFLEKNLYKYKIDYRKPQGVGYELTHQTFTLLEDHTKRKKS